MKSPYILCITLLIFLFGCATEGPIEKSGRLTTEEFGTQDIENLPFKMDWDETIKAEKNITSVEIVSIHLFYDYLFVQVKTINNEGNVGYEVRMIDIIKGGIHKWIYPLNARLDFPPAVSIENHEKRIKLRKDIARLRSDIKLEKAKRAGVESPRLKKKVGELRRTIASLNRLNSTDIVYFIAKDKLHAVLLYEGMAKWKRDLKFTPFSPPIAGPNYLFAGSSVRPRVFVIKDLGYKGDVLQWFIAENNIKSRPFFYGDFIYFADMDGVVYCFKIGTSKEAWKFPTEREVIADLIMKHDKLYVASTDHALYALERGQGLLKWKFESGAQIYKTPVIVGDNIYLINQKNELYVLNRGNGKPKYKTKKGKDKKFKGIKKFIMEGKAANNRFYVLDVNRNLLAISKNDGIIKERYSATNFSFIVINPYSHFLYIASASGKIVALKEK